MLEYGIWNILAYCILILPEFSYNFDAVYVISEFNESLLFENNGRGYHRAPFSDSITLTYTKNFARDVYKRQVTC